MQADGHALHGAAILPHASIARVLARGVRIEPARPVAFHELAHVVHFGEDAGRALRVSLVVRDLEGEGAFAGADHAVARERPAIEVEAGDAQTPAAECLGEHFGDKAPVVFAAGERASRSALPAARLQTNEFLRPCGDVVVRLKAHRAYLAMRSEARLPAAQ